MAFTFSVLVTGTTNLLLLNNPLELKTSLTWFWKVSSLALRFQFEIFFRLQLRLWELPEREKAFLLFLWKFLNGDLNEFNIVEEIGNCCTNLRHYFSFFRIVVYLLCKVSFKTQSLENTAIVIKITFFFVLSAGKSKASEVSNFSKKTTLFYELTIKRFTFS